VAVSVRYVADPTCGWSWASQPALRRLEVEFDGQLEWELVMAGLARRFDDPLAQVRPWLEASSASGMPVDPLIWSEGPLSSSYPACMAVVAAREQGPEAARRCLRALQEGIVCFGRKLDAAEALVGEARDAGLDAERFRIDLSSNAILEGFGADLDRAAGRRLPALELIGEDGEPHAVEGFGPYDRLRAAATAAGAEPQGRWLTPEEAVARFGRLAAPELAAVSDLPEPRAHAELWRLVGDWKLRPRRVGAGFLFEPA
jgi:protein-disulfide isomerase-like protein with CxxC motif